VLADRRVRREDLEVVLVGHNPAAADLAAPLPDGVRVVGFVPHHEAVRMMTAAAVLLLVLADAGGPGIYTTKLFEYLAAQRPILALVPLAGVAADLVRRTRSGVAVPPDDPVAVADALAGFYRAWSEGGIPHHPDLAAIARFEAHRQAADWSRVLEEMIAAR
jgi:glycosyltransferase involved in cell wall biosynthesis